MSTNMVMTDQSVLALGVNMGIQGSGGGLGSPETLALVVRLGRRFLELEGIEARLWVLASTPVNSRELLADYQSLFGADAAMLHAGLSDLVDSGLMLRLAGDREERRSQFATLRLQVQSRTAGRDPERPDLFRLVSASGQPLVAVDAVLFQFWALSNGAELQEIAQDMAAEGEFGATSSVLLDHLIARLHLLLASGSASLDVSPS